jgi:anti-anti-sigma factor
MADPVFEAIRTDDRTLRLVGELDMGTVGVLKNALQLVPPEEALTLDLEELEFIDSTGLHEFARYARSLNGQGPLILKNASPELARLFELVAFDKVDAISIR